MLVTYQIKNLYLKYTEKSTFKNKKTANHGHENCQTIYIDSSRCMKMTIIVIRAENTMRYGYSVRMTEVEDVSTLSRTIN